MAGVDPWGLYSFGDLGRDIAGTIRELPSSIVPGLQTGLAATGSALSLGHWDGGKQKNEPGFGVSKGLAYTGMAAGAAAGGLAAVPGVYAYALPRVQQAVGFGIAVYQALKDKTYILGQWDSGALAIDAKAAEAAYLNLPQWGYSWAANQAWLRIILLRPETTILFRTNPSEAVNTFLKEMQLLQQHGCPW